MFSLLPDLYHLYPIIYIFGGLALFSLFFAFLCILIFVFSNSNKNQKIYNVFKLISIGLFLPFCFIFFWLERVSVGYAAASHESYYLEDIEREAARKNDMGDQHGQP